MNFQFKTSVLIITAIAATGAGSGAFASEAGAARFSYAPNLWKVEGMHVPEIEDTPHLVQSGSVPRGPGFLGLSPKLLSKPQFPAVLPRQSQEQVAGRPGFSRVAPQMPPGAYSSAFGKAGSLPAPPAVASNPPDPLEPAGQAAQTKRLEPHSMPEASSNPAKSFTAHYNAARSVHGVLRRRHAPAGLVANAGKRIDSYGGGYVPGPFLPAVYSTCGRSAQTDVHGQVLRHR